MRRLFGDQGALYTTLAERDKAIKTSTWLLEGVDEQDPNGNPVGHDSIHNYRHGLH
jgi:hypothetical protein